MDDHNKIQSNRQAFRIIDTLEVHYKIASQEEIDNPDLPYSDTPHSPFVVALNKLDADANDARYKLAANYSAIADYIHLVEEKVNILKEFIINQIIFRENPKPPQLVSISETGIAFGTNEILQPQDIIKLKIFLKSPYQSITSIGIVVSSQENNHDDQAQFKFVTAVQFKDLSTAFTRVLSRYILQSQSKDLF